MNRIGKLLALLLIASANLLSAQTGSIHGSIRTSDGYAAEYVNVGLKGTNHGTNTNSKGEFEIKKVHPGTYTLVSSYIGLETKEIQVQVKANEETNVTTITLKENSNQLKDVVISSNINKTNPNNVSPSLRINTPLIELAQNIQIVTNNSLKQQQIISMSDGVLRNVSGAARAEHWGDLYTNIVSRGSQIQAFRNGFNVVNSYWGPLTEDMSVVDHIEFVKGPAGFMLSNGDPGGLYNVVTKKPTGQTKGEASITLGSFDLYRTALDLDGKLSKNNRLLYRLNVSAQNKKSHRPNERNNRYAIAPVISYQLDNSTKLTLEYNYQHADMSNIGSYYVFGVNGYETLPVDFTSLPAGTPGQKINDHSFFVNMTHDFNDKWKLTAQAGHFIYNQKGCSMWPSSIDSNGKIIREVDIWDAKSKMTMGQIFINGDVNTGEVRHRVLGGVDLANKNYMADWGQGHLLDSANAPFDPLNPNLGIPANGYPEFDRTTPLEQRAQASGGLMDLHSASLYLQDELGFFDNKIRLTLAGRYTVLRQSAWGGKPDSASRFTPRVGLSATVAKDLSVYALYDQAFVPQSGRLASGGKVQPITGNNMEIGVKRNWMDGRWNTTLAIYRIVKNNELTADPFSPPASGLSIELGQKLSQGIEFDLRGTLAKGLTLTANYAFTDSKINKVTEGVTVVKVGDLVPGFAKHTANAWLSYKLTGTPLKGTGISLGCTYLGGRATYWESAPTPDKEMNDYFKLDGGLFWENDKINITVNVFNILNTYLYSGSYESWMSTPTYVWQTEAPRNFRLSVNYKF